MFIERCGEMLKKNGYQAMITMHSWMFLTSFEKLREKIQLVDIVNMAHLGARAFEEIGGEVVQTTSFVLQKNHKMNYMGTYCRLVEPVTQQGKEAMYLSGEKQYVANQNSFTKIPGKPVAYWLSKNELRIFENAPILGSVAIPKQGMATTDNGRFLRMWYEIKWMNLGIGMTVEEAKNSRLKWFPINKGGEFRKWYGNNVYVVNYQDNGRELIDTVRSKYERISDPEFVIKNRKFYFNENGTWSAISSGNISVRYSPRGFIISNAGMAIYEKTHLKYIIAFLNSKCTAQSLLKVINQSMNYNAGDLEKLPFIICDRQYEKIVMLTNNAIDISKQDWDSFESSWDFQRHPLIPNIRGIWDTDEMKNGTDNLPQRLYIEACFDTWQEVCDNRFRQLKANEEELNHIFIDIYGLQDELTPDVEDKDVTVRKADLGRDIRSFISYAVGCMFGRYSLDKEGLVVAGQPFKSVYFEVTAPMTGTGVAGAPGDYVPTGEFYIKTEDGTKYCTYNPDRDNIIPITDEEYFSDDIVGRFVEFVKTVYGKDTLEENLDFIARALGDKGNSSREVIRNYFIKDFYKDHLKVYQKRPIYWLFDSGKQNGFKALIYMHRYDADTVGRVRTDYLHKAQKYVETAMQSAQYTIDNATSASEKSKATKAVTKYTKQLAEMKIYDEAIAHVANQRIEIDLDDGVKVNYAKFQGVEVAQEGKKALKVDLLAKI